MSSLQRVASSSSRRGWMLHNGTRQQLLHRRTSPLSSSRCRLLSSMASMNTKFSNTSTTATSNTTATMHASKSALPFLHSRKKLPPACWDPEELSDRTDHVLTTAVGNLFQFNRNAGATTVGGIHNNSTHDDQADAWLMADGTVQMVEYLMRGHAAKVPGTLWAGWNPGASSSSSGQQGGGSSDDPLASLDVMDKLLDRMWDEGNFYMTVRKQHMSQLAWENELRDAEGEKTVSSDWRQFARDDTIVDDGWSKPESTSAAGSEHKDSEGNDEQEDEDGSDETMEDFAMPGPSVDMYDIYLDTIAVAAAQVPPADATSLLTARNAFEIFETILYRHHLDGGDEHNHIVHTMPTQISYNAVMRTAANLPYDGTSEVRRDWALMTAFSAHDALTHSALERNSSTYMYLLQVVAKYMPACTSRGNIARGLWKLAKKNGVYNDQVQEAYLLANEPSNSEDHDNWLDQNIRGKDWRTDAPHRWRRRVKKYRMVNKQTTY